MGYIVEGVGRKRRASWVPSSWWLSTVYEVATPSVGAGPAVGVWVYFELFT